MAVWLNGSVLASVNKVAQRWPRLVLGWVTVSAVQTISVYNQSPR